jgi:ribonucleoside-diphosphate reductase alpha chain
MPTTAGSIRHKFDVAGHEGYLHVGLHEDGTPGELFVTMAKEGSTVGGMMDAFATAISLCLQYGVPLDALVRKFSHQRFDPSGMTSNRDIPFAKSIVDYVFRWLGLTFLDDYRKANLPARTDSGPREGEIVVNLLRKAAPEAIRDEASSDKGRAERASDKDVSRPLGAVTPAPAAEGSMGGTGYAPVRASTTLLGQVAPQRAAARVERVDQQFSHYQEDAPACDVCGSITVRNGNCYKCYNCGSSLGCS